MLGLIRLDCVVDTGLRQRRIEERLHIIGDRLVLDRACDVDARLDLAGDLGFAAASANSLDAVADRDFVLELLAACSIAMIHLSRLCGEIVLWTSVEFSFAALPDALASGSSMMPNKKNPCAAELVRAKSGRGACGRFAAPTDEYMGR